MAKGLFPRLFAIVVVALILALLLACLYVDVWTVSKTVSLSGKPFNRALGTLSWDDLDATGRVMYTKKTICRGFPSGCTKWVHQAQGAGALAALSLIFSAIALLCALLTFFYPTLVAWAGRMTLLAVPFSIGSCLLFMLACYLKLGPVHLTDFSAKPGFSFYACLAAFFLQIFVTGSFQKLNADVRLSNKEMSRL